MVIQVTALANAEGFKPANDYKYVNAKGGSFAAGVMRGERLGNTVVLIHVVQLQFELVGGDEGTQAQPVSHPVNRVLATLEMTEDDAYELLTMLNGLLPAKQQQ